MKKVLKLTITCLLVYLICSFIAWDLNAGNWDLIGRIGAILLLLTSVLVPIILRDIQ